MSTEMTSGSSHSQNQLKRTIIHSDGIEFEAIERDGLKAMPVLSQAFDNQWLPRSLLEKAIKAGEITTEIQRELEEITRAEYIRTLINGEQVVLNRAYIYNNEIIYRDYLPAKNRSDLDGVQRAQASREAFKSLLQDGVIVPYLFTENSPVQPAEFKTLSFREWTNICKEVRMQCVRLSWDDHHNSEYTRDLLSGRFAAFAVSLPVKNLDKYMRDLGLDSHAKDEFRKLLHRVARTVLTLQEKKGLVTREDLYTSLIIAKSTLSVERRYSKNKPFAGAIKQLLDLAYARNLPDALDGYLLTPLDSLPRTALQEAADDLTRNKSKINVQDLVQILRHNVFDFVQQGMFIPSMDLLYLTDVQAIRRMDEWHEYMKSLKSLLENPFSFAEGGAQAVQENYAHLAKQMTKIIGNRYEKDMEKAVAATTFVIELIIDIGAATLSVMGVPESDPIFKAVGGATFAAVGKKAAKFAVRFVIRDIASKRANKGLSTSIELMKGNMENAEEQWNELLCLVKAAGKFKEGPVSSDKAANLSQKDG